MTEDTLGKLGKYELVEMIGEGAMGKVYRALDPVLGRHVAIKLMSASIANDAHLRDRFLREARAAANLQHPNIITIYDFGETEGHPFIAMEYIEGTDLAHLIEQHEPLSLDLKTQLVVGVLHGLSYAHTKGVVHRDIKPANIRVTTDGRVKIMDFGIAHLQGSEITHSGAVLGTPDYMAPEQVRGLPVTAATDIFAAGAVLYELLTYEKPFTGDTLHAVLFKVVTENPRPIRDINPSLPEELQRIVDTALSKEPGNRYPTADAMAADLSVARTTLAGLETGATLRFDGPLKLGLPMLQWWKQKRTRNIAAAAVLVVAVLIGWRVIAGSGKPNPTVSVTTDTAARTAAPVPTDSALAKAPADSAPKPAAKVAAPRPQNRPRRTPAGTTVASRSTGSAAGTSGTSEASPATPVSPERAEIEHEIQKFQSAMSTATAAAMKALMPGMKKGDISGWDRYFKSKKEFAATLQITNLDIKGDIAVAHISATFAFTDARTGAHTETKNIPYIATLEKTGARWTLRDFQNRS